MDGILIRSLLKDLEERLEIIEEKHEDGIHNLGEVLNAFQERLGEVEDKIDELLDLARSQGLMSPPPVKYDDWDEGEEWADPYAGGSGV